MNELILVLVQGVSLIPDNTIGLVQLIPLYGNVTLASCLLSRDVPRACLATTNKLKNRRQVQVSRPFTRTCWLRELVTWWMYNIFQYSKQTKELLVCFDKCVLFGK